MLGKECHFNARGDVCLSPPRTPRSLQRGRATLSGVGPPPVRPRPTSQPPPPHPVLCRRPPSRRSSSRPSSPATTAWASPKPGGGRQGATRATVNSLWPTQVTAPRVDESGPGKLGLSHKQARKSQSLKLPQNCFTCLSGPFFFVVFFRFFCPTETIFTRDGFPVFLLTFRPFFFLRLSPKCSGGGIICHRS